MKAGASTDLLVVRLVQASLLAGAVLSGLAWSDTAESVATTGHDGVGLHVQAPVVAARGPWRPGDVLTEADAGVDVTVAPVWTVSATHETRGVAVEPGTWSASTTVQKVSGDGRAWWAVVDEVPLDVDEAGASFVLDAHGLARRAQALDEASRTPGRLDVTIAVSHAAAVVANGARQEAVRTAQLQFAPSGNVVSMGVVPDTVDWSTVAPRPFPATAVVLGVAAAALEVAARRVARRVPAWERARGVNVVEVASVPVPAETPRCDLATALATAKRTGSIVLVDRARGVAVVQGAVSLVAPLDPEPAPTPAHVPAPDLPTRPLTPLSEVFRPPAPEEVVAFEVTGAVPPVGAPFPEVDADLPPHGGKAGRRR